MARRENVAFTVVVTVLVCLGALPILFVIALSGAPNSLLMATVLAAVPVGPLVACYLWLDRYEPEPKRLLAFGLLWGGFVATAAALLVQGVGGYFLDFTDRQSLAIVAPISEEFCKGLFLFLLLW
jgi:RsiW-degrading membrane proteinase PrsW (M82 family)